MDQTMIQPNTMASASFNVWAPNGALTKAPGVSMLAAVTASGTGVAGAIPVIYADDTVTSTYSLYAYITYGTTPALLYGMSSISDDAFTPLGYKTGTISVSGASLISATGSGTTWAANVSAGDFLIVNSTSSAKHTVLSVEDNTHLTLSTALGVAVATGAAYVVQQGLDFIEIPVASLNGLLCMSTTGNIMQQYDGSNILRVSSAPKAAYLTVFKNYMFAFRTSTAASRLYWSAFKDPTSWPTNNNQDIEVKNGVGTGMFAYGNELILFKNRGMHKVLGDTFDPSNPQYFIYKISTPNDFVFSSNYSCAIHNGYLVFYGGGRFYRYMQGTMFIEDISSQIIRDLPTISTSNIVDSMGNLDQRIPAIQYNNYYVVTNLIDPNNALVQMGLILDKNWKWWYFRPPAASSSGSWLNSYRMAVVATTSNKPQLIIPNDQNPHLYLQNLIGPTYNTNDFYNGSPPQVTANAISSQWTSKEFNIEYGTFKSVVVYLQKQSTGTLTVAWSIDQGSFTSESVDMTSGRGNVIRAVLKVNQKGSTIQLKITHNTISETFKVYALKIYYESSPWEQLR